MGGIDGDKEDKEGDRFEGGDITLAESENYQIFANLGSRDFHLQ